MLLGTSLIWRVISSYSKTIDRAINASNVEADVEAVGSFSFQLRWIFSLVFVLEL